MSSIYCSNCGTRHMIGAKFCSNCGGKISNFAHANAMPVIKQKSEAILDEDGIPETFTKPAKLEYEIQKTSNRYSVKEIVSSPPSRDHFVETSAAKAQRFTSKEEYLKHSMRECASSKIPNNIDES